MSIRLALLLACASWASAWAEGLSPGLALERALSRVAEQASPAVVRIEVSRVAEMVSPVQEAAQTFPQLMQEFVRRARNTHPEYFKRPAGAVTGFVVRADGLVLTSAYNVGGTIDGILVTDASGTRRPARLCGVDAARDVALLAIEGARDLPVLQLDGEARPEIGSFVVVVDRSSRADLHGAAQGIVSALDRFRSTTLQVDARTHYGNTGGPVLDLRGRVLGMASRVNHWINSGQNSGVSYATSSRYIGSILADLEAGKPIKGPRQALLGVSGRDHEAGGVQIDRVEPGSAAAQAGIQLGDRIVRCAAQDVGGIIELVRVVSMHEPGDQVDVEVLRGAERLTLTATLGERKGGE